MNARAQKPPSRKVGRCTGVVLAILLALSSRASAGKKAFVIAISTLHDTFKSGAEIDVGINLTNTSNKPVLLTGVCAPKGDFDGFTVEVTDIHNSVPPETHLLRLDRGEDTARPDDILTTSGPGCGSVPPNGFSNSGFVVSRLYDITKPGKYKIQVQRKDTYSGTIVESNIITITVTP